MKKGKSIVSSFSFVLVRARSWMVLFLWFPVFARAHGTEFVLAKLQLMPGAVRLEMTVDYGQNPMVETEGDAREVLTHVLRTRVGESTDELKSLRFEKRTQFDPTTPIFDPKQQDPEPH